MATQFVPDGVEVVLNGIQNGVPIVNVFHVQDTATLDEARLGVICDAVKAWWDTYLAPLLHTSYTLQSIVATALESTGGPQVTRAYSTGNVGTQGGDPSAANGAVVLSWRTGLIGRSYRGRSFIGAMASDQLASAQTVDPSVLTAYLSAGTQLIDAIDAIGAKLAVLSRFAAGVLRVTGLLIEIISVIVDNKVDSQRRRTAN